jgi:hypothetical protein
MDSTITTTGVQGGSSTGLTETATTIDTSIPTFPGASIDNAIAKGSVIDSSSATFPGTSSSDSTVTIVDHTSTVDNSLIPLGESTLVDSSLGAFPGTSAAEFAKDSSSVSKGIITDPNISIFPMSSSMDMTFPTEGEASTVERTVTTVTRTSSTSNEGSVFPVVGGSSIDSVVSVDTRGSTAEVNPFPGSSSNTEFSRTSSVDFNTVDSSLMQDIPTSGSGRIEIASVDTSPQFQDFPGAGGTQELNIISGETPVRSAFTETNSIDVQKLAGKETISTSTEASTGTTTTNVDSSTFDSSLPSFPEGGGADTFADSRTVKQIMPKATETNQMNSETISSLTSTSSSNGN